MDRRILRPGKLADQEEKNRHDLEIGKRTEGHLTFESTFTFMASRPGPLSHVQRREINVQRLK